jgi:hypothetical protein
MKSGNLNFLEPSGPLQACNGTAIPLVLYFICVSFNCVLSGQVIPSRIIGLVGLDMEGRVRDLI